MTGDEIQEVINDALQKLGEHANAIQILVSWNENGGTFIKSKGCGNWYARQGMAHQFINTDIAQENAVQIAEHLNPK